MSALHIEKGGFIKVVLCPSALQVAQDLQTMIVSQFPNAVPLPAGKLHVTVCSFGSLKPHRPLTKAWIGREEELPQPPRPVLVKSAYLQMVDDRWSWACQLDDQARWRFWRSELLGALGFPTLPLIDEGRVFHLSLANKDGSPFSSVGPAFEPMTGIGLRVDI
jgi:hypothetical protein